MIGDAVEKNLLYCSPMRLVNGDFRGLIDYWTRQVKCVRGTCSARDHFPFKTKSIASSDGTQSEEEYSDYDDDDYFYQDAHHEYPNFFKSVGLRSREAKDDHNNSLVLEFNKVLLADFGLQVFFLASPSLMCDDEAYTVSAYLILPSKQTTGSVEYKECEFADEYSGNPRPVLFRSALFLNPSDVGSYPPGLKRRFDNAMKRLGVKSRMPDLTKCASFSTTQTHYQDGDKEEPNAADVARSTEADKWPKFIVVAHAVSSPRL